jgi:hypothetical protein
MLEYSEFYLDGTAQRVAREVLESLTAKRGLVSAETLHSAGGVGSAIQRHVEDHMQQILGSACAGDYASGFSAKSLPDLRFVDRSAFVQNVNVKAQNMDRDMSMPNLVSGNNLRKAYQSARVKQQYALLWVRYRMCSGEVEPTEVMFFPIEWLPWDNLVINTQGPGVLQMRDGKKLRLAPDQSRYDWSARLFREHGMYHRAMEQKSRARAVLAERDAELWEQHLSTLRSVPGAVVGPSQLQLF